MQQRTQTATSARDGRMDGHRDAPLGTIPTTTVPPTYYGLPMIKRPTWRWFIPLYFFIGGVAGGAALLGGLASIFGGPRHHTTVRAARWVALVGAIISPALLIADLGRPARFHHMLRVFKVKSPLSVGTFILAAFGVVSGLLAARQAAEDNFVIRRESRLGRMVRAVPTGPLDVSHGLLGLGLGGYTGTLLAATAVPLWAAGGVLLGPIFLATALASGAALLALLNVITTRPGSDGDRARADIEVVASAATVAQLSSSIARELLVPERIEKPLTTGTWGTIYRVSAVGAGMLGPLALRLPAQVRGRKVGRAISLTASSLTLVGAMAERFALVEAGKRSADDPLAYQEHSRGAPGEARLTAQQQAQQAQAAGALPSFRVGQVVPEPTGPTD